MSIIDSRVHRAMTKAASIKADIEAANAGGSLTPMSSSSLRNAGPPTHVLDRNLGFFWRIRPVVSTHLVNATDCDYDIVMDYRPTPPQSRIHIVLGDRIEVSQGATGLVLTHTRDGIIVGRSDDIVVDASGLWASGVATVPPFAGRVGDYFLYLVEDSPLSRHTNAELMRQTGPCTQVHFEYFDDNDAASTSHRPVIGTTVFPLAGHALAGQLETDEGDGDEGRRR